MELGIPQQIFTTISKANKILITVPSGANADLISSALGFKLFLQKLQKDAEIATSAHLPQNLSFLPGFADIHTSLNTTKSMVIVVDTSVKELDEISYQEAPGKVSIYLKPKNGEFGQEDLVFSQERSPFDLVIALGAASLEALGALFDSNSELFLDTPKVNIDHHPANEYFGTINLVDISATSVGEILAALFQQFETQLIDEDIATCLLTGIIARTHSFQQSQTTPKSFVHASELVAMGAKQQEIVKSLYKTKSLPLLRLWGRALARLKIVDGQEVLYSMINLSDFGKAGASTDDALDVLRELMDNVTNYSVVALLMEVLGGGTRILLGLHSQVDAENLFKSMNTESVTQVPNGGSYKIFEASLDGTLLIDAENRFLDAIKRLPSPAA